MLIVQSRFPVRLCCLHSSHFTPRQACTSTGFSEPLDWALPTSLHRDRQRLSSVSPYTNNWTAATFRRLSFCSWSSSASLFPPLILLLLLVKKMRFNRQKRHRRSVRFYTACFGFREPYKVLCDGTFIHHLVDNDIAPRDKAVSNTLGGSVKLFTTRCVLSEIQSLRAPYAKTYKDASSNYMIARCDHERRKTAVDCIAEIIGENNEEHFFVATQDADMRKKLQEIPGVPVMYGLRNALFLEQPASFQRQFVKSAEEARQHVLKEELELLRKRINPKFRTPSESDASTADQPVEDLMMIQKQSRKNGSDRKDKAQFKKKRAKGPNPLSCLKKKKPIDKGSNTKKDDKGNGEAGNKKRKRNRKSRNVAVASTNAD